MELTTEFYRACLIAWACCITGLILFLLYRNCRRSRNLSLLLFLLSPSVLTAYGIHSVQVCNQILTTKQGETVDDRIYLASVTRADLGDGIIYTAERYSDGSTRQMPRSVERPARGTDGLEEGNATDLRVRRRLFQVPLRGQSEAGGHWHGSENL